MGAAFSSPDTTCVGCVYASYIDCQEDGCTVDYNNQFHPLTLDDDTCNCSDTSQCDTACKTFAETPDVSPSGTTLSSATASSADACRDNCRTENGCIATSYSSSSGSCALLSTVDSINYSVGSSGSFDVTSFGAS